MQYVVIIVDKKINTRYVLERGDGERTPIMLENRSPNLTSAPTVEHLPAFDAKTFSDSWNVFFAKNEATAKALAQEFSSAKPDKNVFWGKLSGAFESVPSKPIEKVITEKGILPV